jgi:DnaJ-class molecular chaperone
MKIVNHGMQTCRGCDGTGKVRKTKFWSGEEYFLKCKICKGEGRFELISRYPEEGDYTGPG